MKRRMRWISILVFALACPAMGFAGGFSEFFDGFGANTAGTGFASLWEGLWSWDSLTANSEPDPGSSSGWNPGSLGQFDCLGSGLGPWGTGAAFGTCNLDSDFGWPQCSFGDYWDGFSDGCVGIPCGEFSSWQCPCSCPCPPLPPCDRIPAPGVVVLTGIGAVVTGLLRRRRML